MAEPKPLRRAGLTGGGVLAGTVLCVALAGTVLGGAGPTPVRAAPVGRETALRPDSDAAGPAGGRRPGRTPAAPLAQSTPVTLAIPSIGLRAPLLALGLDRSGAVETPPFSMPRTAAWFRDSPAPGTPGASVIVGHVDTRTGPAVFWSLSAVRPGAQVDVTRIDGRTAVFTVRRVREYPRSRFPARAVYGPAEGAELRLVTCGGRYDRAHSQYTGNVVVFAALTGTR